MNRKNLAAFAAALLVLGTGCDRGAKNKIINGSSSGADPSAPLSAAETGKVAESFFEGIMGVYGAQFAPQPAPQGAPQPVTVSVSRNINQTIVGPAGGTNIVTGTITGTANSDTGFVNISISLRETFTDFKTIHNGLIYTINGDPYLTAAGTISATAAGISPSSISFGGAFRVSRGSVSQSCSVLATLLISAGGTGGRFSGTICGEPINYGF